MPDVSLPPVHLSKYHYSLPPERIATHPLPQRDQAKLLLYRQGNISHHQFFQLGDVLPADSLVVFNDTKVIPARLVLHKATGARIELLLLKPVAPREVHKAMVATGYCSWECMIGNKKKWKEKEVLTLTLKTGDQITHLQAKLIDRDRQWVELSWDREELSFAEVISLSGQIPLPPYIKRKATEQDRVQYQTVYSRHNGAVAAPTAGLHFTESVLKDLEARNISRDFVTLHVSAGTFQPVKHENALEHDMHSEQILLTRTNLELLLGKLPKVVAVGTTSMRVLESIYWFGVQVIKAGESLPPGHFFRLEKLFPYQFDKQDLPTPQEAIHALLQHMNQHSIERLSAETAIFIVPGYDFKICQGLITNYHLPETTLILLVAAFVGEDWRQVYQSALDEGYRFLSYGDSSLLWRRVTS